MLLVLFGLMNRLTRGCRALFFCLRKNTEGERHPNMESLYDYGSRAGFWRLHRLFTSKKIPCTVFAVGMVRSSLLLVIGIFLIIVSLRGGACVEIFAIAAE